MHGCGCRRRVARQASNGVLELHPFEQFDEANDVAANRAAVAKEGVVGDVRRGIDVEIGPAVVRVKRTATQQSAATRPQLNAVSASYPGQRMEPLEGADVNQV